MKRALRMAGTLAATRQTFALAAAGSLMLHGAVLAGVLWIKGQARPPVAPPMRVIAMLALAPAHPPTGLARDRQAANAVPGPAASRASRQGHAERAAKATIPPRARAKPVPARIRDARNDATPAHAPVKTRPRAKSSAPPKASRQPPPHAEPGPEPERRPKPVALTGAPEFAGLFPPRRPKPRTPDPRATGPVLYKAAAPARHGAPETPEARDAGARLEHRPGGTRADTDPTHRDAAPAAVAGAGDGDQTRQNGAAPRQVATAHAEAPASSAQAPTGPGLAGLANPAPVYPWLSRRRGEQGRVVLRVSVGADGRPTAVAVKRSSGHARLDTAALRAVRHWRFQPARRAGRAIAGAIDVPIRFRLTD